MDNEINIGAILEILNDKVDLDLNNVNKTGLNNLKYNISSQCMPEYTYGRAMTTPFIAPSNGLALWNNSGSSNATVNGYTVYIGGNDSYNEGPVCLLLSKGDVLTFVADASNPWFVPLKGAIEDEIIEDNNTTVEPAEDEIDYIVEFQKPTEVNNYTWYRKYKSGWVEQGGQYSAEVITLPIPMVDTNYYANAIAIDNLNYYMRIVSRNTTTLNIQTSSPSWHAYIWQVSGMAA